MVSSRWRPVLIGVIALCVIWALALAGFTIARNAKVTPEKVRAYVEATDFRNLSGEARAKAIKRLADMLNALSLEERRQARLDRVTRKWFQEMSEEEKGAFIEATMPTGVKQMRGAFEQLPENSSR